MKSIKDLRDMALQLRAMNILPPYFLLVQQSEVDNLRLLSSFCPVSDYGDHVQKYGSHAFYDFGACEHFRFIAPERRKSELSRRKGDIDAKK